MVFQDEASLIERLKAGHQKAVEQWYLESKGQLLRFFSKRVSNDADAQELVQDTYLSSLSSLPLFRGESGLWSFMLAIGRHELADYWRKKYAKRVVQALPFGDVLLDSVADPHGREELRIKNQELREIVTSLPEEISELLQLKYIDGLSVKELAQRYGLSFAAMQSKLYRAKEVFKKEYEQANGILDQ